MIDTESCLLVFFLLAFLEAVLVSFRLCLFSPSSWFSSSFSSFFSSFFFCSFASPGAPSSPTSSNEGASVEGSVSLSRETCWPLSLARSSLAASEERKAFLRLRRNYLLVYLLAQASEWIQGPYMFVFYSSSCRLSLHHVGILFLAEYASAGLFGCLVGCVADICGHRRACLIYCLLCLLSCAFTRFSSSSFALLLLGRVVGGAALSVLETAFEAWVVTAHLALRFPPSWLEETLGTCTLFNGLLAIFVGFLSSAICKAFGIAACFDLAAGFAVVAAYSILALLPPVPGDREDPTKREKSDEDETPRRGEGGEGSDRAKNGRGEESGQADEEGEPMAEGKAEEGKGDGTDKEDVKEKEARRGREEQRDGEQRGRKVSTDAGETVPPPPTLQVIFRNKAVQACGAVQIFFEVPMYIFFVTWTPALDSRVDQGVAFACFMVCVVLGSEGFLQSGLRGRDPRLALRDALSVGAVALAVPATAASHTPRFAAFCIFEVVCGVYYPCIATVRAQVIDERTRATVVSLFRLPLNAAILLVGGWGLTETNLNLLFAFSAAMVAAAAFMAVHLIKVESEQAGSGVCAAEARKAVETEER
ncbi:UNVERIFIED_CONTAM: transporter, major facilitator family protein [Hammondia hammondi]|eukprot:XP_008885182.1 transporter, major facilitator family protein [Hammondia hammondi]